MKIILTIFFIIHISALNAQTYTDKAISLDIVHSLISSNGDGSGVNFFDFDNDGWDDLTLLMENDSIQFYKNNQGTFIKLPSFIFNQGVTKQVLWVDYDNDGFNDMLVTNLNGSLLLYNNDGNFNFTLSNVNVGIPLYISPNYGASFADYNKDGFLDLFICRYSQLLYSTDSAELNTLYRNNGNGTFSDVTFNAGLYHGVKMSFQAVWLDYNADTWPDLFIINDKNLHDNQLFENNHDGTFSDVTTASQTANSGDSPMSNSVGDFDNDGDLDIYTSNSGLILEGRLMVNNNDGTFTESAQNYGVNLDQWSWGATWLDMNNDGHQDLYVTTTQLAQEIRSYLYMSTGNNWFNDSPQLFTSNHIASSFAAAKGDYNQDGFADLIVQNGNGYNSFFWKNSGNGNSYVNITVHGTVSNKMAIGTWVKVYANGLQYSHYTLCGENYMSQNSQHHLFGLDQASIIDSVVVTYVSGITDHYYNLSINQAYNFFEGESYNNQIVYSSALNFCVGDSVTLDAGTYASYLWSNGSQNQYLTVTQSGSYWVEVTDSLGLNIPSDTLTVIAANLPQISINAIDLSCYNVNNGALFLDIIGGTNIYTIQWNGGLNGDTLYNLSAGTYAYVYTDNFGCVTTDSISVNSPFLINVQTLITPYTSGSMGMIQSIINGGTPPYTVFLDSVLASNNIDSLLPGQYLFEVYDANNCYYIDSIAIIDLTLTGIENIGKEVKIFPNPMVGNTLQISALGKISSVLVYDVLGQIVLSEIVDNTLTLLEIYYGIAYLTITIEGETYHFKLLKL